MLFGLAVLIAMASVPLLPIGRYELRLLTTMVVLSAIVVGFDSFFGHTGLLNLGTSGFVALGAYSYVLLRDPGGLSYGVTFVITLGLAVLVSWGLSWLFLRLRGELMAMATLVFSLVIWRGASSLYTITGGDDGISVPAPVVGGFALGDEAVYLMALAYLAIVFWGLGRLYDSRVGRALTAIRTDEEAAVTLGVPVRRHLLEMFVLSGVVMFLGGWMQAQTVRRVSANDFGLLFAFDILVMTMVAGARSRWGLFVGVAVMTMARERIAVLEEWTLAVSGLILLAIVFLAPRGLAGLVDAVRTARRGTLDRWSSSRADEQVRNEEDDGTPRRGVRLPRESDA